MDMTQEELLDLICLWIEENKHKQTPHMQRSVTREIQAARDIARDLFFERLNYDDMECPLCEGY